MSLQEAYSSEEIDLIGTLLKKGLSASQVAESLSRQRGSEVTRSMIVGKVHRDETLRVIGFKHNPGGRPGMVRRLSEPRAKAEPKPKLIKAPIARVKEKPAPRPVPEPVVSAPQYDAATRRIPLEDLDHGDCRWPVNDPAKGETFLFCGHSSEIGHRYCRHHWLRSRGYGTEGERRADEVLRKAAA